MEVNIVKSFSDPNYYSSAFQWGLGDNGLLYFIADGYGWFEYGTTSHDLPLMELPTIIKIAQEFQELYQFYAPFR